MKILLTTDFTKASENAIEYTLKLFKRWDAQDINLLLIHAFKPIAPYSSTAHAPVMENIDLEVELRDELEGVCDELRKNWQVKSFFETGSLPKIVREIVKKEEPDLIVMGSREKTTLERLTIGANTIEVVANSSIPVLAVPSDVSFLPLKEVVLTTDLEPLNISNNSLTMLKEIISKNKAGLKVLHVFKEGVVKEGLFDEMENTAMHQFLQNVAHEHVPVVNKNIFDGIIKYVNRYKPELLVVIPRDHNFIEKIFHKSMTEEITYHTHMPVLILVK